MTEDASGEYELKDVSCSGVAAPYKAKVSSASTALAYRKAAIKVGVGEKVTCVFTNQRKTGKITVKKELRPVDDAGRFDLQVDGHTVKAQAWYPRTPRA